MKTFLIILSIIAILIFLLYLDFQLGKRAQHQKINRKNHPFRYSDFHIYSDGTELFPALFQAIEEATDHVHILFYTIKTDSISKEFLNLLKSKAHEGVEVRLILDWLGSYKIRRKVREELKKAGIQFAFCQLPSFPYLFYSLQVRNHRKIAIIDGKVGFMGGFNIGKDYIHANIKLSPWRDYHLKLIGEGVDDLQREFLMDWLKASKINLLQNRIYFPVQKKGASRHQIIPTQGVYLEEIVCHVIKNCKSSLLITTPYFIPSKQITSELLRALHRNISITILIPDKADHLLVKEASFPYLRTLLAHGASVYQYMNGFFHGKLINIDNEIIIIGSANFDRRSIFLNHELNCCIYDQGFIERMNKITTEDLQQAKELSLEGLDTITMRSKLKEWIARLFAPFL
ncbi:cardiolipin synthase [Niallia circulans]|jgi:cardiolipin synthase A/B|uniref:Cardiolipin synthase n=1 Tax=Niallia circulans TaxID=1397 RepID=A0A0J1ING0_NIACI|nr:cardiolipin synthase [Niallia circulans]KLV27448.1 cardiolipin synthetase [Niallia circulans]MCM2981373.1 cardiolipin synthase [Niallia circulans]MDR4316918.1 cardiolipin synthase [Niallia circulans]MED3840087.1 cardiolipin synthase [Niallia circulans]MED4241774.1 cardiolipin synthase [Niallia circulans]